MADALGISRATLWQLVKDRRAPAPIKIGGSTRWRIDELRAWIRAGAPKCDSDKPGDWRYVPVIYADIAEVLEIQRRELSRVMARVRETKRLLTQNGPAGLVPVALVER